MSNWTPEQLESAVGEIAQGIDSLLSGDGMEGLAGIDRRSALKGSLTTLATFIAIQAKIMRARAAEAANASDDCPDCPKAPTSNLQPPTPAA